MSEASLSDSPVAAHAHSASHAAAAPRPCEECVGSGGWYRYEPALDPAPGLLYLSCLQCRGSGRTSAARA